ncbi:MAG TPA: kelch repeat-containing protein [Candidatus Limnocylindrales bacterium]
MTDRDLELRLRDWFAADARDDVAPAQLRESVLALPRTGPGPLVPAIPRRQLWWLAAAAMLAIATSAAVLTAGRPSAPSTPPTASSSFSRAPSLAAQAGAWTYTGDMVAMRSDGFRTNWAVLLLDGRVIAAGGDGSSGPYAEAELFDPATEQWTATAPMSIGRAGLMLVVLRDGRVLAAGGYDGAHTLASAELFDPVTQRWTPTGSMTFARSYGTATLLDDGRVLVAGGMREEPCAGGAPCPDPATTAETYDPVTGSWTRVGDLADPAGRWLQTATKLADGRVLLVGGHHLLALQSAEVFDPRTDRFVRVADMAAGRSQQSAVLLSDGKVLVLGGQIKTLPADPTIPAELFDPATGTWRQTSPDSGTGFAAAATLADGRVLAIGGGLAAWMFDPPTEAWSLGAVPPTHDPSMLIGLQDGRVVAFGVRVSFGASSAATYVFDPKAAP